MELIINGDTIKSKADFHEQIRLIPGVPHYYGNNLDALNDVLRYFIEPPIKIIWTSYDVSKDTLGEYADKALSVFVDAVNDIEGLEFEIRNA